MFVLYVTSAQGLAVEVHEAEEGGFWADVPSLPGCGSQGETLDELQLNIEDAIEACVAVVEEDALP